MFNTKIEMNRIATATFAELDAMLNQAINEIKAAVNHTEYCNAYETKLFIEQAITRRFG